MDPITIGLLLGAATGAIKGASDSDKEKRQRVEAAAAQRWSPWTGIKANAIQTADMPGSIMQGGLTGAIIGQGYGGSSDGPKTLASSNGTQIHGKPMDGSGLTADNANAAPGSAISYGNPNAGGYGNYPGGGVGARQPYLGPARPPAPGQMMGPPPPSAWNAINY